MSLTRSTFLLSLGVAAAFFIFATKLYAGSDGSEGCPIYETRDWAAKLERSGVSQPRYVVRITGEVDAPNPSYLFTFRPGPMDRRLPPAMTVLLDASPSGEIGAQVIDQREVAFRFDTDIAHFREINVFCSDRLMVSFADVRLTE